MSRISLASLVLLSLSAVHAMAQNPFLSSQPGYPNWSPFSGVRWETGSPHVEVEGTWYELRSIHGVTVEQIRDRCENEDWPFERRFEEDIVQILRLMGQQVGRVTSLELIDTDGKRVSLTNIKMTEANLDKIQAAAIVAVNPFYSAVPGYPTWSPFEEVKWSGDAPTVKVKGKWYTPISVHDIAVDEILKHSEKQGWSTKTRFTEDLVQMIRLMGKRIDRKTDLVLRGSDGTEITMSNFEMRSRPRYREPSFRVDELDAAQLAADLDHFEASLRDRFAYARTNRFDYASEINAIRSSNPNGMKSDQLANAINRVMMSFIDGHAGVSGSGLAPGALLPLRLEDSGTRVVALRPDRTAFFNDDFPYLIEIDGEPITTWIDRTSPWIAEGSTQMKRRRGIAMLETIGRFCEKNAGDLVELTLAEASGNGTLRVTAKLTDRRDPFPRTWPVFPDNGILENQIGYLRLPRMDSRSVEAIRQWMPKFRGTAGLIVDVRGNGGGIRTPILELAGYLMGPDDPPRIGNVAKYRLAEDRDRDHLSRARYVYREDSPKFGVRERAAIKAFAANFTPEWEPPAEEFSQWHFLVLSKSQQDPRYRYQNSVVILTDTGCFSATDIFLSTFKGWPNVTLLGQPSGGGRARTESFRLPNSGISVRCASMASFQPTGELYDTHGISPDVLLEQPAEHFLVGGPDEALAAARKWLLESAKEKR